MPEEGNTELRKSLPINSRAIVSAIVAGLVLVLAYGWLAMPAIRPHVGEGKFENHSWRFPWPYFGLPVPGYEIDFPDFDLASKYETTYRIEQLPDLPNSVGVYLAVDDPNGIWRQDSQREKLTAEIELEVIDEQGNSVLHVKEPLSEMRWASPEGGDYGLYKLDESFFVARKGARYSLRVRYSPDPRFTDLKGFVHIRCGGSI